VRSVLDTEQGVPWAFACRRRLRNLLFRLAALRMCWGFLRGRVNLAVGASVGRVSRMTSVIRVALILGSSHDLYSEDGSERCRLVVMSDHSSGEAGRRKRIG